MKVLVGPARAWASIVPPDPGASLSWSGVPSSITRSLGTTYGLSQHVEYDGEESLTYSSIGTSLSGTGISLNTSTGVLTIDGGASTGTVSGIQIRVSDGTLTSDSAAFAVVKVDEILLGAENIQRIGAFKLPADGLQDGGPIAVHPAGNSGAGSMFVTGQLASVNSSFVCEVTLPTPSASTSIGDLPRATILQALTDATEGTLRQIAPNPVSDSTYIGGLFVYDNSLIISAYTYYAVPQSGSHWKRPLDLSDTGNLQGPLATQAQNPGVWLPPSNYGFPQRLHGGCMCPVPAAWQSALGGTHLVGVGGLAQVSGSSAGPAICSMNMGDVGSASPIPTWVLCAAPDDMYSPEKFFGYALPEANIYWSRADFPNCIVFPDGSDCVLVLGGHGQGLSTYGSPGNVDQHGTGVVIVDPARPTSQGVHAYPYAYQVWAYRAADLAAVKAGTKAHYEVEPYAVWTLDVPLFGRTTADLDAVINGLSYDIASGRLYLSMRDLEGGGKAVVQVFEFSLPE